MASPRVAISATEGSAYGKLIFHYDLFNALTLKRRQSKYNKTTLRKLKKMDTVAPK